MVMHFVVRPGGIRMGLKSSLPVLSYSDHSNSAVFRPAGKWGPHAEQPCLVKLYCHPQVLVTCVNRYVNWNFLVAIFKDSKPGRIDFNSIKKNVFILAVQGLRYCAGFFSSCGAWVSYCAGFFWSRAQAPGHASFSGRSMWAQSLQLPGSVVVVRGLGCPKDCGIFPDQGSNLCLPHWQVDSSLLSHQGSLILITGCFFFFNLPYPKYHFSI